MCRLREVRGRRTQGAWKIQEPGQTGQSERSRGRDRLVSDAKRHGQEQGHPVGGNESSGAMREAKARPGVSHRLGLEEREGTVGGGGGSYVTITGEGGSRLLSTC